MSNCWVVLKSKPNSYSPNSTCCITSRHDTHDVVRVVHVGRVVTSVSRLSCVSRHTCLFQHGGRRKSSSARVYKFNLLCSGFASISAGTTFVKVRWTCSPQSTLWRRSWTRVVRVALVVTSVLIRLVWQARRSTSRLFTVSTQNAWAR